MCVSAAAFTDLDFTHSHLVRSNLGGLGGRCFTDDSVDPPLAWSDVCLEECDVANGQCDSPPEIYMANVGTTTEGDCLNLKITNETECARCRRIARSTRASARAQARQPRAHPTR